MVELMLNYGLTNIIGVLLKFDLKCSVNEREMTRVTYHIKNINGVYF